MPQPETRDAIKQLYRDVLESPKGRDLLEYWRRRYDALSYAPGDTHQTAFNEGRRSVYRDMLAMIAPDPKGD